VNELLVVDDDAAMRRWEERVLGGQRYTCQTAGDVPEALAVLNDGTFDLALLDVNLPGGSGLDLLTHIRSEHAETAVLMVTGEDDLRLATAAIELGAYGYLVKPVRAGELLIGVATALHRRRTDQDVRRRLERLETDRARAEDELHRHLSGNGADTVALIESESLHRLVRLAEFRDEETGRHLVRMSRYCELIGVELGLDHDWCNRLRLASELHDVGKVAIPDRILLKPGRLTASERKVMETHAEIGHRLLSDSDSELMRVAALTALTHHERWDGTGYPSGVGGEEIPLEGRIAAVADVFDALTSDRVYRAAFPVGMALTMMDEERGRHFDPDVLDALHATFPDVDAVRRSWQD
jgi:putative two-component system response regulator